MQLSKKKLKKMREILLKITPDITALLDEFAAISKMRISKKDAPAEVSAEELASRGVKIVEEVLKILLERQYDRIVGILAAIYETEPEEIEEKTCSEIADMVIETLSDDMLIRFFPLLTPLKRKTQSGT